MRGVLPAILVLLAWCVVVTTLFYCVRLTYSIPADTVAESNNTNATAKSDAAAVAVVVEPVRWFLPMKVFVFVANATLTTVINAMYVYSTQQPLSAGLRFCVQLGLAVFRLGYAYCVLPMLPVSKDNLLANMVFIFRLTIVNNFIIPCVVTAFASPSCFRVSKSLLSC